MIGTNNTGHRKETPRHTALGIKRIIDEIKLRLPSTKILLLDIFPRGPDNENEFRKINSDVNDIIRNYADDEAEIFFLSIGDKFLQEDGTLSKSIMPDLLHPNSEGYQIWAEAMEPMIGKLLRKDDK